MQLAWRGIGMRHGVAPGFLDGVLERAAVPEQPPEFEDAEHERRHHRQQQRELDRGVAVPAAPQAAQHRGGPHVTRRTAVPLRCEGRMKPG